MKTNSTLSVKTQILSLLLVIASAVSVAFVVAAIMVNHYESSKNYLLRNVLLSPQSIKSLLSKSPSSAPFNYSTWDSTAKSWKQFDIDIPAYTEFYALIEKDTSLEPVPDEALDLFNQTRPATLTLYLHINEFQKVQFINDYYRVELHMEAAEGHSNWAYFYHPSIDKRAETFFTRKSL